MVAVKQVTARQSLRALVEKWLGATSATPVRVVLVHRIRFGRRRCVCIKAERAADSFTLFFFRHDDGAWHVFPPDAARPAMSIGRLAA
jgi:hypothetical protein